MTTTTFPSDAGLVAGRDERLAAGLLDRTRRAWRDWRAYRTAIDELEALDVRQRDDIGLAGHDLRAVSRTAVYGN